MEPGEADQKTKEFEDAVFALMRLSMPDRIRALEASEQRNRLKYSWIGGEPF